MERTSPRILVVRAHDKEPATKALLQALQRRTVTFATLHEALMLLDPELARLAALRRSDEDLAALRTIVEGQQKNPGDFQKWCRLDENFHVTIAEAGANAPLVLTRATLGVILAPTVALLVTNEQVANAGTEFHRRIYEAIAEGDPDLAMLMARRHIEDFKQAWERSGLDYDRDIGGLIGETVAQLG